MRCHDVFGGRKLSSVASTAAQILRTISAWEQDQAGLASRTASYERRADDWLLQSNLAARELMQIGKQVVSSLIREQITRLEYENQKKQIEQSMEIDQFLHDKFTNEELYGWMQGELSKLYYEYYKFAFDIARQAEKTMKHELMRPELDKLNFLKFNYWDGGRKGLLSGEALNFDLKRMEMSYHEHNKREYELTKHISLRQLDPLALLNLKTNGGCEISLPEWLFDLDAPGHYMRRIKNVSLSIPAVIGPYTGVNCTLSLQKSSLRRSSLLLEDEYNRFEDGEDARFIDYYGTIQSIVTSNAQNDSGLFETNIRDERFLPFEGHGVISSWKLELPNEFRQFDYDTISDVIIHLRYTARQGGDLLKTEAVKQINTLIEDTNTSGLVQLFSMKHDFPTEWHQFVGDTSNDVDFVATVKKEYFPYLVQDKEIEISKVELFYITEDNTLATLDMGITPPRMDNNEFDISLDGEGLREIVGDNVHVFLIIKYNKTFDPV